MVLNNSGSLFQNQGLYQDDGSLSERWGQQGSTLVNDNETVSSDRTMYTVSTNKTLFVKQITIGNQAGGGSGALEFRDGNGGTLKLRAALDSTWAGQVVVYNFEVPLSFETSIYVDYQSAGGIVTITGWEE